MLASHNVLEWFSRLVVSCPVISSQQAEVFSGILFAHHSITQLLPVYKSFKSDPAYLCSLIFPKEMCLLIGDDSCCRVLLRKVTFRTVFLIFIITRLVAI
jgi:hypothetical protein